MAKLTPETQKTICDYIKLGLTQKRAAELAGVSESAFYKWKAAGKKGDDEKCVEFLQSLKKATAESQAILVSRIQDAAKGGAWQAAAWILERRHHDEWGKYADKRRPEDRDNDTAMTIAKAMKIFINDDIGDSDNAPYTEADTDSKKES